MAPQPLRRLLLLQPVLTFGVSMVIAVALGYAWVLPRINEAVERNHLIYARTLSTQIDRYLEAPLSVLERATRAVLSRPDQAGPFQELLTAVVADHDAFSAIYFADYQGRIHSAGLMESSRSRFQDVIHTNLAANPIFKGAAPGRKAYWSEVFLSPITGGLSAAHVAPVANGVIIAETDLGNLTGFLKRIGLDGNSILLVIDQKGQVIVDQQGTYTAMQMNIATLPPVRAALASNQPASGIFTFEGKQVIGAIVPIPSKGWFALVASTLDSAYSTQIAANKALAAGFVLAVLISMAVSHALARHLSRKLEVLARNAGAIAAGRRGAVWPETSVTEFNQLSATLQDMAANLDVQNEALRRNEQRLSLAISATADAIWEWHSGTGEAYFSPRWFEMLGYAPGQVQMTFEALLSLIHPADLAATQRQIALTLAGKQVQGFSAEFRLRRRDGSWLWVLGRGNRVEPDRADQPGLLSGTITDISSQKALQEQLHQSQKMESIGRLAGGVAHDFNNMLGVILGSADLCLGRLTEPGPMRKSLEAIKNAAERSSGITRQLLAFSRKEVIAPQPLDLNRVVVDLQKNLGRLVGEDVTFSVKPGEGLWTVMLDPTQIDQILMNLSVNARDAMPDGGTLTFETANVRIDGEQSLYHLDARPGAYVRLTVTDTGCGMDRETREHIFEPFFTTKGVGKGTGLGLATVYGIVTQNDGFITCTSEVGRGTAFSIHLPRWTEEPQARNEASASAPLRGQGTILLVEDEQMLLLIATDMLTALGYDVIQAPSPEAALALCDKDEKFDLILTDVVMPDMNGKEMVDRIRVTRPQVKVLFMSGYPADILTQRRGGLEAGMNFIQKPLDLKLLSEKVSECLGA